MKFTFFQVLNPEQVYTGSAKPHVTEVGPFSYKEVREKQNTLTIDDQISFGRWGDFKYFYPKNISLN